jgi:hypothetical protein
METVAPCCRPHSSAAPTSRVDASPLERVYRPDEVDRESHLTHVALRLPRGGLCGQMNRRFEIGYEN